MCSQDSKRGKLEYWEKENIRNMERDNEINRKLNYLGWTVIRFWEAPGAGEEKRGIRNKEGGEYINHWLRHFAWHMPPYSLFLQIRRCRQR